MKASINKLLLISTCCALITTQGCAVLDPSPVDNAHAGHYDYSNYYDERIGSGSYNGYYDNSYYVPSGRLVTVPKSYHLEEGTNPTSHKHRDKTWVTQQSPDSYTIELANDKKASHVANTLHKAPKNERTAQIRYRKKGESRYTGVYGTYKNRQSAEKALQKLPANIRNKAGIQKWRNVQENIDYSTPKHTLQLPKID